jgi:hypothetical protein
LDEIFKPPKPLPKIIEAIDTTTDPYGDIHGRGYLRAKAIPIREDPEETRQRGHHPPRGPTD